MDYHATTSIVAGVVVCLILWLIRTDHLHPRKALFWIVVSTAIGLLGVFPEISDWLASQLGISYPPTLVFAVAFVVILVKLLRLDIVLTQERHAIIVLSQRVAILDKRLEEMGDNMKEAAGMESRDDEPDPSTSGRVG